MIIESFKIKAEGSGDNATLRTYIVDSSEYFEHSRRPMVFICPGGGYEFVSHKEGEPLALQFTAMGYHAAVLTYSVKPAVYPTQLMEIAQAWKIIRENADRWNVLTDKIIIMGGSAGGHLAASYGIFSGEDFICRSVGLTAQELRPAGTPPAFIWHTFTDNVVPSENSMLFAMALKEKGVNCELHIFPDGGHGLALANEFTQDKGGYGIQRECVVWIELVKTWLGNKFGFGESL